MSHEYEVRALTSAVFAGIGASNRPRLATVPLQSNDVIQYLTQAKLVSDLYSGSIQW
jgi:hypothetical protein